jgi:hypothetical protein
MTKAELNRAVASATGDRLSAIRHRGFGLLQAIAPAPEWEPLVIDWDCRDQERGGGSPPCECGRMAAAGPR